MLPKGKLILAHAINKFLIVGALSTAITSPHIWLKSLHQLPLLCLQTAAGPLHCLWEKAEGIDAKQACMVVLYICFGLKLTILL